VQAVNTALAICLNPDAPQTCPAQAPAAIPPDVSSPTPTPSLAPATAPTPAAKPAQAGAPAGGLAQGPAPDPASAHKKNNLKRKKLPSSESAGVIAGASSIAIAAVLAGLVLLAFVVRRRKRRASASGAAAEHGHLKDIDSLNAGHAAGVVGGAPPPAPSETAPAAVFTGNAPTAPREAAVPAAVVHVTAVQEAGIQGAVNQDKAPLEDESAMLTPTGLPPTATLDIERSDTWTSAKGSGIVRQQEPREPMNSFMGLHTMLNAGLSSTVDSSQVAPLPTYAPTLCMSLCVPVALHAWGCAGRICYDFFR
jgi:hypothetical protein